MFHPTPIPHHQPPPPMSLLVDKKTPKAQPPTQPNNTLYVRNLHEKVKLILLESALKELFGKYGNITQMSCKRHVRLRGQAFITFDKVEDAIYCRQQLDGFPLFNKDMDVQYARQPCFVNLQDQPEKLAELKRKRDENKALREQETKRRKQEAIAAGISSEKELKNIEKAAIAIIPEQYLPPNAILFVQNVSSSVTKDQLNKLFSTYPGFVEIRTITGKHDIAFVEYENEAFSTAARDALNGHVFENDKEKGIKVTYAKK